MKTTKKKGLVWFPDIVLKAYPYLAKITDDLADAAKKLLQKEGRTEGDQNDPLLARLHECELELEALGAIAYVDYSLKILLLPSRKGFRQIDQEADEGEQIYLIWRSEEGFAKTYCKKKELLASGSITECERKIPKSWFKARSKQL